MTTKSNKAPAPVAPVPAKAWHQTPVARKTGMWTLVALVVGTLGWAVFFRPYVSTDDARVAAVLVRLAAEGSGGRVLDIKVKEGDPVKTGEVLVDLDQRMAKAEFDRASARADLALRDFKRVDQLSRSHGVSAKELDVSRGAAQQAQADLALAQTALDNTEIKSPLDGVVVQKSTEVGNILAGGQTALTLADVDGAWVSANIEETSVSALKLGQKVKITVDEGGSLSGQVSEIGSAAASQFALIPSDNASGNYTKVVQRIPIKIALDPHPKLPLRAGESVEIRIKVR